MEGVFPGLLRASGPTGRSSLRIKEVFLITITALDLRLYSPGAYYRNNLVGCNGFVAVRCFAWGLLARWGNH